MKARALLLSWLSVAGLALAQVPADAGLPNKPCAAASTPAPDAEAEACRAIRACLKRPGPLTEPEWTPPSLEANESGRFLLKLRFIDAEKAPEVEWLSAPSMRHLRRSVERFVADYRYVCPVPMPVELPYFHVFPPLDGERYRFADQDLAALLGRADFPVPVNFDTTTMGCPFEVNLTHWRPHLANTVREIGGSRPERAPLLAWLGQLSLRLDPAMARELVGRSFVVRVPCARIDL